MQFVAWDCDGCSVAPPADYTNNEILQELPKLKDYFTESDERVYLDLRRGKGYMGKLEKLT